MGKQNVVLVTGASTGIGKACAEYLARKGFTVYGTSRRAPVRPKANKTFTMLRLDVTDAASVERCVKTVLDREERLDAVVNNAGVGMVGPIEDVPLPEAEKAIDTNCMGVLRVCKAMIPVMRKQGGGCIVNISSGAGIIGLPFQGVYSMGKFAVEGLSEALRIEVRKFGIRVALVEPGDIRPMDCSAVRFHTKAYEPQFSRAHGVFQAGEKKGYPPERIGPLVERILLSKNPRLRHSFGQAFQAAAPFLKRVVPQRFAQWALSVYLKL